MSDKSSSTTVFNEYFPGHQADQPKSSCPSFDIFSVIPVLLVEMIEPAPDTLEDVIFLEDTEDSVASKINEASLYKICARHGTPFNDMRVLTRNDRAHMPSEGFIATSSCVRQDVSHPSIHLSEKFYIIWG